MICFAFIVFESKVGSLSTSIIPLIGLFLWMATVAVYANTPTPKWAIMSTHLPHFPRDLATQPVSRPDVDSCPLSLLSHSLESTGGISM